MKIAALSDFHIGVSDYRDGFRHDLAAFGSFLDQLERDHDAIVLLGDIYQTDHGSLPSRASARRHLAAARQRVGPLASRLDEAPYTYVYGNHDRIAATELGAPEQVRLGGENGALFIHGHQFDPVARKAQLMADVGTWTTGRLRAFGMRPLASFLERRDVSIKDARFRGPEGPYVTAGRSLASRHDAKFVVMGHTHVGGLTSLPQGIVANTGTCSGGHLSYLSIDTIAGKASLHDGGVVNEATICA